MPLPGSRVAVLSQADARPATAVNVSAIREVAHGLTDG
jgi:hypothetical protein